MNDEERLFRVIVWPNGPFHPEQRIELLASGYEDARSYLLEKYGEGNWVDLTDVAAEERLRSDIRPGLIE